MFFNFLISLQMRLIRFRYWTPFIKQCHGPKKEQQKLLLRILKTNAQSEFGKLHKFEKIKSYKDYVANVPVQSAPVAPSEKVVLYAQTSGTTNAPKLIPITKQEITAYKRNQKIFSYALYKAVPKIYSGKVLAIVSPGIEGHLENGTPYGSMSGLMYLDMPDMVKKKYVIHEDVFAIKNYDAKYRKIAELALAEPNVTLLASANPSTFFKLLSIMRETKGDDFSFADLWPNLQAVVTWTGGSSGLLIQKLIPLLPQNTKIIEMGYMASEMRGTITMDGLRNTGVPTLRDVFFEFTDVDAYDNGSPVFFTLDQVKPGMRYYIFVTTLSGLYRYHMNDIVEITGWFHKTPTIKFIQKGKGVTNITGEKLYESQIETVLANLKIHPAFHMTLADESASQYVLYLEQTPDQNLQSKIELQLQNINIEYKAKVGSGRLKPIVVNFLKTGTGEAYKQHKLAKGQREAQYKTINLQYKKDCDFDFDDHV